MRILVSGAAGSLGRVITVGLAAHGHEVVGLDLVPAPEGTTFAWHEADCADADAVAAVFAEERLDAVVHLAGVPEEVSLPDELVAFAEGSLSSSRVVSGETGPDDVVCSPLPSAGLALVVGRAGTAYRARERRQVAALARILDTRLRDVTRGAAVAVHPSVAR